MFFGNHVYSDTSKCEFQSIMNNWILFFSLLATAMGQSVVFSLMPALGRESGLSELQIASILSFSALVFALGSTFWGKFSTKWGRRSTLIIGLSGYSIGTFVFASVFYLGITKKSYLIFSIYCCSLLEFYNLVLCQLRHRLH